MSEDDRAVMERLAALEAEVKADAEAKQQRKEAALAKVREQRAREQAERDALRERQAALHSTREPEPAPEPAPARARARSTNDVGAALELASRAHGVKQELTKPLKPGEKSWVKSALASTLLGPIGWLYAGSWREAVPASVAWIAFAALVSNIGFLSFLLLPVLVIALPLSGLGGLIYAVQYNRTGRRQRLFGDDKDKDKKSGKKQLASGDE